MPLIIDGYNLLHATGITGQGRARSELERSRLGLLNFIADALLPEEAALTIVVFDAAGAPPGLPATLDHRGLVVRFAKGYAKADELIEELIQAETSPRRLTVVSSDHAVQRAAKRRRATAVDSEVWYEEIQRRHTQLAALSSPAKLPSAAARERSRTLSPDEVEFWLAKFTDPQAKPAAEDGIFPPGYGDDASIDDHD